MRLHDYNRRIRKKQLIFIAQRIIPVSGDASVAATGAVAFNGLSGLQVVGSEWHASITICHITQHQPTSSGDHR